MSSTRRLTSAFEHKKSLPGKGVAKATPARGLAGKNSPTEAEAEADEVLLRQFDLESKYGPVSGMTRLERWERAVALKLDPPAFVPEIISKYGQESSLNQHLFTEGKV